MRLIIAIKDGNPLDLNSTCTAFIKQMFVKLENSYRNDDVSSRCKANVLPPANRNALAGAENGDAGMQ